jgi:hypothetical protein
MRNCGNASLARGANPAKRTQKTATELLKNPVLILRKPNLILKDSKLILGESKSALGESKSVKQQCGMPVLDSLDRLEVPAAVICKTLTVFFDPPYFSLPDNRFPLKPPLSLCMKITIGNCCDFIVGNPSLNPGIWTLFKKIITERENNKQSSGKKGGESSAFAKNMKLSVPASLQKREEVCKGTELI